MTNKRAALAALVWMALSTPALAHGGAAGAAQGFSAGFLHPFLGWDHVAAMVAVGLWAASLGGRGIWILPVAFPLAMAVGAAAALAGAATPGLELWIAGSALVIGLMVALALRPPVWFAAGLVALFAVFHGFAHGAEAPAAAGAGAYVAGFALATLLLHLTGVAAGLVLRAGAGRALSRGIGALIAGAGAVFLVGALG